MLQMQPKLSLGAGLGCSSQTPTASKCETHGSADGRLRLRHQWINPSRAFHQSFDQRTHTYQASLSNSCGDLDDSGCFRRQRRSAYCSGVVRGAPYNCGTDSGTNSASGYNSTSNQVRPPALGGRSPQSSFDSNGDVGQISVNFMRVNGTIAPFKTLLTSLKNNSSSPAVNHKSSSSSNLNRIASLKRYQNSQKCSSHFPYDNSSQKDGSTRRLSDALSPIIANEGADQGSKKSLSLVLSEDLEAQRNEAQDDSQMPLMRAKEKNGGRLIQRQQLFLVRRVTSDYALFFAILGIILMVIENELSAAHVYEKGSILSFTLKSLILLSTILLVAMVIKFHVHEVQLFMNANSAEDWRIAITWRRLTQIALEISACSLCPLPFDVTFTWVTVHADGETVTDSEVSLDVLLSIPMFFRLYWLCRVMLLHSRLFTDASSRSIAGLNRVNFNARFILKTLMTLCPGTMLMVFTASLWVIAGWILRLCERHHVGDPPSVQAQKHQNYLNSLWLIAITFLSVGYGDIVPNTYCGRAMAVVTGVLGTCTSSMVVAVIARKLELSRAEKHVHNFMMDTQLTKQLKHSAANVLRETWLIYKNRRLVEKIDPSKIRLHQRKFLVAIYALRKVKRDQRKLTENSVSLGDVAKTTSNSYELIHDIHSTQEGLSMRMTAVEQQLMEITKELSSLVDFLKSERKFASGDLSSAGGLSDRSHNGSLRRRNLPLEV